MSVPVCFPTPLPDETLYSILCRYHVRSCNATAKATFAQLFGRHKPSLYTSMLSPYPLKYATSWKDLFYGITTESFILKHSSLSYFQVFRSRPVPSLSNYSAFRYYMTMYNHCCTFTKKLRYCPKCAQSQRETFGTSYWQILPQIRGYEICLLHNEPIRETALSHHDIQSSFFPASCVIGEDSSCEETKRLHKIKKYWEEYHQQAEDINYIFRHSCPGICFPQNFCNIVIRKTFPEKPVWVQRLMTDEFLYECDAYPGDEYISDMLKDIPSLISRFEYLPICLQLYFCRIILGDIRKVCSYI